MHGGKARFVAADLSDADDVRRLAAEAGRGGHPGEQRRHVPVRRHRRHHDADFDAHFDTNLRAPYILVQQLVPGMVERGHGSIVNVSTIAATTPAAGAGIYGASKAALELLTKVWADEFGASGVRVNAVAPGPTRTTGHRGSAERTDRGSRPHHGARAHGEPDEIANAVTFLASPAASYINGAVLRSAAAHRRSGPRPEWVRRPAPRPARSRTGRARRRTGPVSASVACSGCGISPTTRPLAELMPGDVAHRTVGVVAVAEHHPALALEFVEHGFAGHVAALAGLQRHQQLGALLVARCPRRRGRRHLAATVAADEVQAGVAGQRARQQPGLAQHLKSVADAQHRHAAGRPPSITSPITGANLAIAPQRR